MTPMEQGEYLNQTLTDDQCNTTINLSHSSNLTELGGENVSDWWKNLSQSSDNLTSWGSEPRRSPGPPSESDIRTARMAKIIRDNHLA
jgi:hypothetical protein